MKPGYTIGITTHVNADGDLGLFSAGIKQNCHYLHQLFKASPNCKRAWLLIDGCPKPVIPAGYPIQGEDCAYMADVIDQLDYVVSLGTAIEQNLIDQLHARGAKTISYKGGNGAVMSMESLASNGYHKGVPGEGAEAYYDHKNYDAIWVTPQHWHTARSWYETLYQCPVHMVPQVWSPDILEASKAPGWGYKAGDRPWRISILDPNNTVMKTSHWPMLVFETAYRRNPEAFASCMVCNSSGFVENPSFKSFALALSSAHARNAADTGSIMSFEPRAPTAQHMAAWSDAVITHQWENDLNYLYYDVLYGGYPLIHNSEALKDYGYYYAEFDAEDGARSLLLAKVTHDARLRSYRARNLRLFAKLSPYSKKLQAEHEALLP